MPTLVFSEFFWVLAYSFLEGNHVNLDTLSCIYECIPLPSSTWIHAYITLLNKACFLSCILLGLFQLQQIRCKFFPISINDAKSIVNMMASILHFSSSMEDTKSLYTSTPFLLSFSRFSIFSKAKLSSYYAIVASFINSYSFFFTWLEASIDVFFACLEKL